MTSIENHDLNLAFKLQGIKDPCGQLSGKIPTRVGKYTAEPVARRKLRRRPSLNIGFNLLSAILRIKRVPPSG
jgi:hypothetical protein